MDNIIRCYNCSSDKYQNYDSENGYNLVKCNNCGLLYVNPQPSEDEINKAMMTGMHRGDGIINVTGKYSVYKVKRFLKILDEFYPKEEFIKDNINWLDIGCGFGELLEALYIHTNKKINAIGSEPNEYKIASARKRKLNVSFIDLDKHNDKYKIISLFNVFSHLPNPVKFFEQLKKNLLPDGELFIETGHSSHLPSKLHHKPYYLPDHLSFANKEIVENILRNLNFEIIKTKTYRHPQFPTFKNPISIVKSSAKVLLRKESIGVFYAKEPNRDMFIRCKLK